MTKKSISDAINDCVWAYSKGKERYIDEFIKNDKSARDMLGLYIFPNAKEITESYAAFNAARTRLKFLLLGDENVNLVAVGDGKTPRTAALFAFRTKWNCISIDPELDHDKIRFWESQVQRLTCIPKRVEEVDLYFDKCLIVAVHSHAKISAILDHIKAKKRSLIAIPCCISYEHDVRPREYRDAGIWSPKNLVKVWKVI